VRLPGGFGVAGTVCLLVAGMLIAHSQIGDLGEVPSGRGGSGPADSTPPAEVRLPGAEDDVPVTSIGVERSGTLEPPEEISRAGWWRGGAALGDKAGTVVLAGHVDAERQGVGSFAALWRAKPGQTVEVRGEDDREVTYRITGTRVYPRTGSLPASIFAGDGTPRLALITCAGGFNRSTRHYTDTLVVYAVPVSSTAKA
jgi:hypothetical protein